MAITRRNSSGRGGWDTRYRLEGGKKMIALNQELLRKTKKEIEVGGRKGSTYHLVSGPYIDIPGYIHECFDEELYRDLALDLLKAAHGIAATYVVRMAIYQKIHSPKKKDKAPLSEEAAADFDALAAKLEDSSVDDIKSPVDLNKLNELFPAVQRHIEHWDFKKERLPLSGGYFMFYAGYCLHLGFEGIKYLHQNLAVPGTIKMNCRGVIREYMIKVKNHKPKKRRKVNIREAKAKMIAKHGYTL